MSSLNHCPLACPWPLLQRVPALPSSAFAGLPPPSVLEALAVHPPRSRAASPLGDIQPSCRSQPPRLVPRRFTTEPVPELFLSTVPLAFRKSLAPKEAFAALAVMVIGVENINPMSVTRASTREKIACFFIIISPVRILTLRLSFL